MSKPVKKRRTAADFKAAHDADTVITGKIRAALAKMAADFGPEHFEYDMDFCIAAGISTNVVNKYRAAFAAHLVEAPAVGRTKNSAVKYVWFATPAGAKKSGGTLYAP